jgi:hypothetical protein
LAAGEGARFPAPDVEDANLVFAGDQRPRLPDILRARGVRQVTVGS